MGTCAYRIIFIYYLVFKTTTVNPCVFISLCLTCYLLTCFIWMLYAYFPATDVHFYGNGLVLALVTNVHLYGLVEPFLMVDFFMIDCLFTCYGLTVYSHRNSLHLSLFIIYYYSCVLNWCFTHSTCVVDKTLFYTHMQVIIELNASWWRLSE